MAKNNKKMPSMAKSNNAEIIASLEAEFKQHTDIMARQLSSLKAGDKFIKKVGEQQYNLIAEEYEARSALRNKLAVRIQLLRLV